MCPFMGCMVDKQLRYKNFLGTSWKKIWFQERFASCKQMFGMDKMSPLLLRINLPQIFTIYDIYALWNLSKDFQENILRGIVAIYNRYSEQSVYNLTKRRTLPPVFSRDIFKNGWLWTAASEQSETLKG